MRPELEAQSLNHWTTREVSQASVFIPNDFWCLSMSLASGWENGGKHAAADSLPRRIKTGFVTKEGHLGISPNVYAAAAKSRQSYLTLCHPIDSSPPSSPVPGIFQARVLEWLTSAFSPSVCA